MADNNVISEVRAAKSWLDAQCATFAELAERLRVIEQSYQERSGEFAAVPQQRPAAVQSAIDAADREPGRGLLQDIRSSRTT